MNLSRGPVRSSGYHLPLRARQGDRELKHLSTVTRRYGISSCSWVGALAALAVLALAVAATAAVRNWSEWTSVAGPTSLSPSLAFNSTAAALELAWVRSDGGVDHTRTALGNWSAGMATGQSTALPPVLT